MESAIVKMLWKGKADRVIGIGAYLALAEASTVADAVPRFGEV